MTAAPPDIFSHAAANFALAQMLASDEFRICTEVADDCFKESPTEPVWKWAASHVWLDEIMTSEPGWYDPDKTPWMKEIQEIPVSRPDVRVVAIKKSSRSGASEAAFNILRYMPHYWPGNAGLVFPEDKQGRDVVKRRIMSSLKQCAGRYFSGDADDEGLSAIHLLNMVIKMGPSGSARMFTEWWVRFFILDELEEHVTTDTTSTVDRALSRQVDVSDSLCMLISKPKKAGGPIDEWFIKGSQKRWNTLCPRCSRPFVLGREHFTNPEDCRNADGTWNLELVEKNTFVICPHCQGRILEAEKRIMNAGAVWIPTESQHRRRGLDGKPVPAVPGVESYQISDYVSYHPAVTWGKLRVMYLMAFEIQPTRKAQAHLINNHDGECEEPNFVSTDSNTIDALKAGRVETRKVKSADGSEIEQTVTLGIPGGYRLAFRHGAFNARMPFSPTRLLIFADKQQSFLKYAVFALRIDPLLPGQCETFLVDLGRVDDESELLQQIILRDYSVEGSDEPVRISAGFIDSRYRGQAVFEFCLKCWHEHGLQIWPVRGEGTDESHARRSSSDTVSKNSLRGRVMRFVEQWCEGGKLMLRYFKDHDLQDLLNDKLVARLGWRIWLPTDYPPELAAELIAEKYDPATDTWIHNKQRYGPNDWRDCFKYLVLWLLEHLNPMLLAMEITPDEPPPETSPDSEKTGREYILKPPQPNKELTNQ